MLLEFRVKNFRSIKDWQSFSMLAENKVKEHSETVIEKAGFNFLSSAIVYGRNASGKSNLLQAFIAFQVQVLRSAELKLDEPTISYQPYRLDQNAKNESIEFLIDFIADNKLRYVYSVGFSEHEIEYEKLIFYPKSKPAVLFNRIKNQKVVYGEYLTGPKKEIEELLYPNQLFLSKVGTVKNDQLMIPFSYFSGSMLVSTFHDTSFDDSLIQLTGKQLVNSESASYQKNIDTLMRFADTGIDRIDVLEEEFDESSLPDDMPKESKEEITSRYKYQIRTIHKTENHQNGSKEVEFKLRDESTGTKKLFLVGSMILEVLEEGLIFVIDELDKSLHPKLTRALIKLFHSKKTNPNNAQLIFATHDVSLLDPDLFRRDQVWFAEKEQAGDSHYYALTDIPGVRANTPYEKWYMSGRFGATPSINEYELDFQF